MPEFKGITRKPRAFEIQATTDDLEAALFRLNDKNGVEVLSIPNTGKEAIQSPTLLNSWANFGGGYRNAGFYKDPFGRVHLLGVVSGGTLSTVIFTLPTGYRPSGRLIFVQDVSTGPAVEIGRIDVLTDGSVQHVAGGNAHASLQGMSFRAEA